MKLLYGGLGLQNEFMYVDDMAASVFVHNYDREVLSKSTQPNLSHINVGTGIDVTIKELAETIKNVVGFNGAIVFDQTKPDGTPRKLLNVEKLNQLGYVAPTSLRSGLKLAYRDFLQNSSNLRM